MNTTMTQLYRLYSPSVESMHVSLPDIGSSLNTACSELSRDLSLDRLDQLSAQLNSAQNNLRHLRLAMLSLEALGTE